MDKTAFEQSHLLRDHESHLLNDFLSEGWRVIEVRKTLAAEPGASDRVEFFLGARDDVGFPEKYRKLLKEGAAHAKACGF